MRSFCLVLLAVTVASAAPKTLPTSWQKCKRTDPKLEECLRDAVHVAVRELSENGAKEFGVFPIDPLFMSKVDIEQGKGPVSIDLHFTDLNIHGLKDLIVMGPVKAQVDQVHFEAQISVPKGITLRGLYKVNGKVLLLPIQGNGECELNLENANATVKIDGTLIKKDDIEYGNIKTLKFELDTTRLKIRLENLFNGRKDLSDNMNAFLNENWREILQELKPSIQDAFGAAFAEIINRIFSKVPFNNLFL